MLVMDPVTVFSILQWSFVVWVCTSIVYGIYNIYFHPLRHFPGPQLCAAYRFPYVIENVRGRLPQKVLELHQKYGPVVRIAPNELAFAQAEAWNDIYGLQPGRIQHQKDRASYLPPEDRDFGAGLIHASDGAHARLRRIFGQAFTPKALEGMSGTLIKYSDMLVEQLRLAVGNYPVQDISAWFNFTTFDLTGEFALGEAFHCLEKGGQSHFFLDAVLGGIVIGCQIWQLERYGLWTLMEPFLRNSIMKKRYRMASFTRDIVDQRLKNGFIPGSNDVLNYLLENKRPEDHLPASEIYRNAITLVVAGSETTATLLSGVLSLLGGHQDVLVRVQQEVRSAFESNNDITPASVNKLPYMLAVLSESARLFPASPWGFPRIISSKTGQTVAGHWVPEGTRCDIFHHAAYRYEANFSRPLEFLPERFLPEGVAEFGGDQRGVMQPFSYGPRACIGKHLAIAEQRLILAKMLWNFDFELEDPSEEWHQSLRAFIIWDRKPLRVHLRAAN